MKRTTLFLLFFIAINAFSQNKNLEGCWFWDGSEYFDFEVRYDQSSCQMIAYGKNNKSIMSNDFFYYKIINDTINYLNYSDTYDTVVFSYVIDQFSENILQLKSIPKEEILEYKKICDNPPEIIRYNMNEFYFDGEAIIFVSDTILDDYKSGLTIGWININQNYSDIINEFGNPFQSLNGNNGKTNHIFLLDTIEQNINYIVITERNDSIFAIQLTRYYTNKDYSFSSIRLGDYVN